jgi:hypothetical protein
LEPDQNACGAWLLKAETIFKPLPINLFEVARQTEPLLFTRTFVGKDIFLWVKTDRDLVPTLSPEMLCLM